MAFVPSFQVGDIVSHSDIIDEFRCSNMGGIRRSRSTNTLVLICNYTKGLYHDKWIGGVLHYTGTGKRGDQDIHWSQNETLANSNFNGIEIHLFEVLRPKQYTYCGVMRLVDKPYREVQKDEDGLDRWVWMFPLAPVNDNFEKPAKYTFTSKIDYEDSKIDISISFEQKPKHTVITGLKGKRIKHKVFGTGVVKDMKNGILSIAFDNGEKKTFGYDVCVKQKLIEFL